MTQHVHIILDMDSTLLSIETLDSVIETALTAQLNPEAIRAAMEQVHAEMDKGMAGDAKITETIPARIAIAKDLGAPVLAEHFEIVAKTVPHALTPGIVEALEYECGQLDAGDVHISIVSGGPQQCVDAAAQALKERIENDEFTLSIQGFGNTIVTKEDGSFDPDNSIIHESKIDIIRPLVESPVHTIMIGDAATDVEVFDEGFARFFIAVGIWKKRDVLFDRPDNPPFFLKVAKDDAMKNVLHTMVHAAQD